MTYNSSPMFDFAYEVRRRHYVLSQVQLSRNYRTCPQVDRSAMVMECSLCRSRGRGSTWRRASPASSPMDTPLRYECPIPGSSLGRGRTCASKERLGRQRLARDGAAFSIDQCQGSCDGGGRPSRSRGRPALGTVPRTLRTDSTDGRTIVARRHQHLPRSCDRS